ncbi:BlaI/MecI/CopY family transcriptional regulator [Lachnoanaerobaculum sp. Marseille-Q4761]|uniref:BlaI/MecI/CopY family transcriptional regulator n=1 Tax=Lachnoanaerobaculum sp. Marseille-Q4761 TaxID=2819511 RepID=UPI001FB64AF0|nr:BlaI/MecI/CopY family transcriptional regulator [Lachnoanaerobaculum sp. Marseille-Q4761]
MQKLSDSELKIMEILWREKSFTAKDIAAELSNTIGWDKTTTYTMLRRCVKKNLITRKEPNFICEPSISKEQVSSYETKELIDKMYNGKVGNLVAFLLNDIDIADEEIARVKEIINDLDE